MKVVLFCGGLGMRLRDYSDRIPKPMVPLRHRPILWHVMKYYAHFGHKDFILCLGYQGDVIKDYFLNYNECISNDFVLSEGGRRVDLLKSDIDDWRITFVDTGINANIGDRLRSVQPFLEGEEMFLANYSDGLTDCPLPRLIEQCNRMNSIATFLAVKPSHSFHVARLSDDNLVSGIHDVKSTDMRINGGFFVLRQEIFDYMREGEELVLEPFQRLIDENRLSGLRYDGFWRGVDTFKDLQEMETMLTQGRGPWEVWRDDRPSPVELRPQIQTRVIPAVQEAPLAGIARRGNGNGKDMLDIASSPSKH
ncbi:sugar phosphate nucleotidyltransferase [Telmatospirillum sp. J64-1]|uniref:sugar phosphate nucleotidyltransferase n=1 Tax=Telmatospirillum sp. J64-1 TaxID=2502183 RepID=UPI001C8F390F|nr:sugar phosphate nucleotidyltransferase [Telmatospirillum sp. J64-1]